MSKIETLTTVERLQLSNQYRILQKLDPGNADDYKVCQDIVEAGYTTEYPQLFQNIGEEMSTATGEYVHAVLSMFSVLRQDYEELSNKDGIAAQDVTFRGFDGNNESEFRRYAIFLRDTGKYKDTLGTSDLNTHSQTTSRYRRMVEKFGVIEKQWQADSPMARNNLTALQIKEIIDHHV